MPLAGDPTTPDALATNGPPVALFAARPASHSKSQRPRETLKPVAKHLNLHILTPYTATEYAALAKKVKLNEIFQTIGTVRPKLSIPLVAMVSYSIVFRYGLARFLTNAKMAGFNGLILPDLPPPGGQGKGCSSGRTSTTEPTRCPV